MNKNIAARISGILEPTDEQKARMFNNILDKYQKEDVKKTKFHMKKISIQKKAVKTLAVAAAVAIFIGGFSMTSFGQELYQSVKTIFLGEHAQYVDDAQGKAANKISPILEGLEGKLYDKDGNVMEAPDANERLYNKDGEEVVLVVRVYDEDGNEIKDVKALTREEVDELRKNFDENCYMVATSLHGAEIDEQENDHMTVLADSAEAKPYLAFDFSLPTYLPKGYDFDRIELSNNESGQPVKNGEYAYVYFSNGDKKKEISLQLRLMNSKTAYETSLGNAKSVTINGHKGIISEHSLDIEIDGVMYMFSSRNAEIRGKELTKIAESL